MTSFNKFYIYTLWLSAYIYGVVKPPLVDFFSRISKVTKSIYNYFIETSKISSIQNENSNISLFVSDGKVILPFSFNIQKLNKQHLLYYVPVKIDDNHNKVIVFNSLDKLVLLYNNLEELAKQRTSKFSKYLDVRNTNENCVEYVDTFNEYTDKSGVFYSDITGYSLKARDIYDFRSKKFVLSHGDKLHVTKMDLSSQVYHFDEHIV